MIKLVVFDLDGTLINAYPAVEESVNYVMRHFGKPEQTGDAIMRAVGWGPKTLLSKFLQDDMLEEGFHLYNEYHAEALLRGSSLLPGAMDLLMALKDKGCKLAVASNRPKKFSLIAAQHLGIRPLFEMILCGDELESPKPHPQILFDIMKELECSAEETLYVGDMAIDAQTGAAASVKTIIVTTGSSSLEEIKQANPWKIINRVDEVLGLIG